VKSRDLALVLSGSTELAEVLSKGSRQSKFWVRKH